VNAFWSYFLPFAGIGLITGIIAGLIGFRLRRPVSEDKLAPPPPPDPEWRRKRSIALGCGVAIALAAAGLWHGPLGAANRFSAEVERNARLSLDSWEMPQVAAQLHLGPLTRHIILSGRADDFQRSELIRIIETVPGVSHAQWAPSPTGPPLILEGIAVTIAVFLVGLLLAYVIELRRRYNAQWNW